MDKTLVIAIVLSLIYSFALMAAIFYQGISAKLILGLMGSIYILYSLLKNKKTFNILY